MPSSVFADFSLYFVRFVFLTTKICESSMPNSRWMGTSRIQVVLVCFVLPMRGPHGAHSSHVLDAS